MTSQTVVHRSAPHALDGLTFDALLVRPGQADQRYPLALVFHGWEGRSEGQEQVAEMLAALGYAAVCVDLYGGGQRGSSPAECEVLMRPLINDRALLRTRLLHVVDAMRALPEIDPSKTAAIGFCFGGLCVLDLARAGAPLDAVASFHGMFTPSGLEDVAPIKTKIIAFHGWDDPLATPADVVALGEELSRACADWQLLAFGGAMHAFMSPGANNPGAGVQFHPRSAARAWRALQQFLAEALS